VVSFLHPESIISAMTATLNFVILIVRNDRRAACLAQAAHLILERIPMTQAVRVLVVDDQPRARQSLKALLATWPIIGTIREAATGKEALALVEESPPDLALIDVRMPEMDGLEATRRIKAKWPQVKIIVLSVYTEHAAGARAAGADAFVCKCEPPEALLNALEQAVSLSALRSRR
jgi:CheY-like chemotaxis protein